MRSPMDHGTEESRDMQPHDWPGERNPSQWDVHDAHQVPEVSFLRRFKAALLLSEDATGCRQYLTQTASAIGPVRASFDNSASGLVQQYTYPMSILSELPLLPESDILTQAQSQFSTSFKRHVFLSAATFPEPSSNHIVPPYLKIALACLGTAASKNMPASEEIHPQSSVSAKLSASDLFLAGDGLWGVMMEVDNREARLLESVLAGCLYATYGMLSADEEFWDLSSSTIAGTATMARRVLMHCEESSAATDKLFLEHNTSTSSLLMSYLFLTDVTRAAHCGRVACISTKELFMRMPSSPYNFHQMYSCLVSDARTLPSDLRADEDSLLLLTGICADILYIQHSFSNVTLSAEKLGAQSGQNPYAPLSPTSEALRHHFILSTALARWHQHFGEIASRDVLSMFYFCRLLLASPDILRLPCPAGYPPNSKRTSTLPDSSKETILKVSDEAMNFAWLILDNSNARADASGANVSIWLPVVLFFAALTIWYHLQHQSSSSNLKTGTLRTLNMFKDELTHLPWPCCVEMCRTLDKLMSKPINRSADQGHRESRMYETRGQ